MLNKKSVSFASLDNVSLHMKNRLKVRYDDSNDALSIVVQGGREFEFDEIAPGVGVEKDAKGNVIGFEILNASKRLKGALPQMARFVELKN